MRNRFADEIRLVRADEERFPQKLLPYPGMPDELYYMGALPDPALPAVAIVGARMYSPYGRIQAFEFARVLSENGVQVISGLATGIDSEGHRGALAGKTPTFAVLGCGADICYPRSALALRDRIIRQGGGILSEFPPGTQAQSWHFPIRNRIISALSDLILVVEARKKSGSLITAGYALDQGKPVYALPGSVSEPLSQGTNHLIFDGAGIALSPEVLLEELGIHPAPRKTSCRTDHREDPAWRFLHRMRTHAFTPERMAAETGLSIREINSMLMTLVLEGTVRQIDPCTYVCIPDSIPSDSQDRKQLPFTD